MKSRTSSKVGYVGSETRSQGHILEKPCVCSRGHIFGPILMKLGQNVRMIASMKSQTSLKMGHVGSKTKSQGQIFKNKIVYALDATFSVRYT